MRNPSESLDERRERHPMEQQDARALEVLRQFEPEADGEFEEGITVDLLDSDGRSAQVRIARDPDLGETYTCTVESGDPLAMLELVEELRLAELPVASVVAPHASPAQQEELRKALSEIQE